MLPPVRVTGYKEKGSRESCRDLPQEVGNQEREVLPTAIQGLAAVRRSGSPRLAGSPQPPASAVKQNQLDKILEDSEVDAPGNQEPAVLPPAWATGY